MSGEPFVTRKITRAVAVIVQGLQGTLFLGNLYLKRDWSHAKDYNEAMWRILQHDKVLDNNDSHGRYHYCQGLCNHGDRRNWNCIGI